MRPRRLRQKVASLAVFLAPVLLVKGVGVFVGAEGPAAAKAATNPLGEAIVPAAAPAKETWTAEQRAAAAHVATLRDRAFGDNPMYYPAREVDPDPAPTPNNTPSITQSFSLQAILNSSRGATVVIDGKLYKVDDEIGKSGWRVVDIKPFDRSAIIEHIQSGTQDEIAVETPNRD